MRPKMPALDMKMSTCPKRSRVVATIAWMSASRLTSQRTATAPMSRATPCARSRFTSATTMPAAPFASRFGNAPGSTSGSFSLPS